MSVTPWTRPAVVDRDPSQPTGRTLRWGIVGTGNAAHSIAKELKLLPDAELVGVASRNESHAQGFARRYDIRHVVVDPDMSRAVSLLAASPDVDVVFIGTPHGAHAAAARAAIEAGKAVLCEKPMTLSEAETRELVDLARAQGTFLMEGLWTLFHPGFVRAIGLIRAGEIGTPRTVTAATCFPGFDHPESRIWKAENGGGAFLDLLVYPLAWIRYALGEPTDLHVVATTSDQGVDVETIVTMRAGEGVASAIVSIGSDVGHGVRVGGCRGTLSTSGEHSVYDPRRLVVGRAGTNEILIPTACGRNYVWELREVTRCVQEGLLESPTHTSEDALAFARLLDQVKEQL